MTMAIADIVKIGPRREGYQPAGEISHKFFEGNKQK